MGKIIKDALILFAITLVAGLALGGVYQVTKQPIEDQNTKKKQAAYQTVLADADSFEEVKYDKDTKEVLAKAETDFSADSIDEIVAGVKGGKIVGYVITVTAGDGYGGDIQYSVGVSAEGECKGVSLLAIGETAGLGMRAKTDPNYLAQYAGVKTDAFVLVKDGTGSSADNKIDAIGGSTITSKAITKGINAALVVSKDLMSSKVKTVGGASVE